MAEADQELVEGVAIVGMAGRVPGARTIDEYWRLLVNGVEAVTWLTDEQLDEAGVDHALRSKPGFVRAGYILEGAEDFDASFFGFSPREAAVIDPQQRQLLECAYEALERAGCDPDTFRGAISVFAGVGGGSYLLNNLLPRKDLVQSVGEYQLMASTSSSCPTIRTSSAPVSPTS
jgi:acyl transferase domain-containing protein